MFRNAEFENLYLSNLMNQIADWIESMNDNKDFSVQDVTFSKDQQSAFWLAKVWYWTN
jgi:hypothetical protein